LKIVQILIKHTTPPVNSEVLVDLKNIESPGFGVCSMDALLRCG
jgi:hypothetical protein